jgi:hypothetical protein
LPERRGKRETSGAYAFDEVEALREREERGWRPPAYMIKLQWWRSRLGGWKRWKDASARVEMKVGRVDEAVPRGWSQSGEVLSGGDWEF